MAANPAEWFKYLKADGCKYLRLYFKSSKDQNFAKDHQLPGFLGGGGTWLIEAIYDSYSNYWANSWEVTDQNSADNKIWTVNYGIIALKQRISNLQIDNETIKATLKGTLTEIADFAFRKTLENWVEQFEKAKATLDSSLPEQNYYHKDLIPLENYSLTARQILFAAGMVWVFGGMGPWNDLGFDSKEDNETYNRLSEQLYANINEAIIAATNTN